MRIVHIGRKRRFDKNALHSTGNNYRRVKCSRNIFKRNSEFCCGGKRVINVEHSDKSRPHRYFLIFMFNQKFAAVFLQNDVFCRIIRKTEYGKCFYPVGNKRRGVAVVAVYNKYIR